MINFIFEFPINFTIHNYNAKTLDQRATNKYISNKIRSEELYLRKYLLQASIDRIETHDQDWLSAKHLKKKRDFYFYFQIDILIV